MRGAWAVAVVVVSLAAPSFSKGEEPAASGFSVRIEVDASRTRDELPAVWRFFGADEPNYAYMKDGEKLLKELGALAPKKVFFRTHNLLTSGDGSPSLKWGSTNAYTEDAQGKPVYDWTIADRIFDAYLKAGLKPYVQIGFMPEALSIKPEPYRHRWTPKAKYDEIYTGWSYPPKDYSKWGELAYQWAKHCAEKYGRDEVAGWYWEVWNEPNIGYWRGTREEFFRLHDEAIRGVRRAVPSAKVGGPDMAGSDPKFLRAFIEHCLRGTKDGTPLDFISFHAKGNPRFVNGRVRMGLAEQLRTVDQGFATIESYPELKGKPVVIGESDPDGCAACQGDQLGYRNGTMYSSYTIESVARQIELAERRNVRLEGALTWAFEFEDQPYFAGFRVLASNGIDLPVMNAFRMFSQMKGRRAATKSSGALDIDDILKKGVRERPDVSAIACVEGKTVRVLAWRYQDDDVAGTDADVTISLAGLPATKGEWRVRRYSVDENASNAFTAWKKMGSPQNLSSAQYALLEKAGRLTEVSLATVVAMKNDATTRFSLPSQAVSLLVFEPIEP